MTVYVDDYEIPFRNMLMCHMTADTVEELHTMAKKIGIKREHFQDHRIPHYDISKSKRKLALKLGAMEKRRS